jgi:hypothetical protein
MIIAFTLSVALIVVQRSHIEIIVFTGKEGPRNFSSTFIDRDDYSSLHPSEVHVERKPAPKRHWDCAINWLRLPKTASTSVTQSFIQPLLTAGRFTITEVGPSTCIESVGGCAPFWKGRTWDDTITRKFLSNNTKVAGDAISAPGYIGSFNSSQRCYPTQKGPNAPKVSCQEYDSRTSIMNFGPHRRPPKPPKPGRPIKKLTTKVQAHFDFGPNIATHVGLDPSLFGWVLPPNPLVFSTFREPIDRLLSSFHYGIQFGAGRPGEVERCDLPGVGKGMGRVDRWNKIVVKAREIATLNHNWTEYQSLLRIYLKECNMAADNAYVQFLDPFTKDVNLAVSNLEKYVIVGLQTDLDETMKRWINITKNSCRGHLHYDDMYAKVFQKILTDMQRNGGFDRKRKSTVELKPKQFQNTTNRLNNTITKHQLLHNTAKRSLLDIQDDASEQQIMPTSDIKLISPDVSTFDKDLQMLIRKLTEGDSVVYERVLQLYEEQRNWGL